MKSCARSLLPPFVLALSAMCLPRGDAVAQKGVMLMNRIGPSASTLYVAQADGSNEHALLATSGFDYHPSWSADGRWLVYYHPGDIGDAWADGHAGVKPEITEFCYQLGVNVIYYAHAEYAKWLMSRMKK